VPRIEGAEDLCCGYFINQRETVMKKMNLMSALVYGMCACGTGLAYADEFFSFAPFVGNFDGVAGLETALPNIKNYDANLDGYPESFGIRFDVYAAGTKTLKYSTAWRYFNRPAIPANCDPAYIYWDSSVKALRRTGTTRIHFGGHESLECWDTVNQKNVGLANSYIYSADVSSAAGTIWVYKLAGHTMDGFEGIDTDGDGVNDTLMVSHTYDVTAGIDGGNAYIVTLNPATGAILSNVTYPISR